MRNIADDNKLYRLGVSAALVIAACCVSHAQVPLAYADSGQQSSSMEIIYEVVENEPEQVVVPKGLPDIDKPPDKSKSPSSTVSSSMKGSVVPKTGDLSLVIQFLLLASLASFFASLAAQANVKRKLNR